MSHAATNWAIQQRGLKPTTKIVLWHLCDRHNPDFGCFPTQVRLAEDAEMSISSLNDHLKKLESLGLIKRIQCHDHRTKRRQATRYLLGFELAAQPNPSPNSGDGANSEFEPVPSPKNRQIHLRNSETNLVREPLSKPVKEEHGAAPCKAQAHRRVSQPPEASHKKHKSKAALPIAPSLDEQARFYAEKVLSNAYLPPSMISASMCQAMLERGLVSQEQLRMRGVL